jgi:hypothetical protein
MCTGALEEARSPESHSSCDPFAAHIVVSGNAEHIPRILQS